MEKTLSALRLLDWTLAGGITLWGLVTLNPWWLGVGAVSLVLVYLNPGMHIKRWLERKFLGRSASKASSAVAVREAMADLAQNEDDKQKEAQPPTTPNFGRTGFSAYGPVTASLNPRNRLRASNMRLRGKPLPWA